MIRKLLKDKKGAAMVEYGLVVAGVALIGAGAASVLGHKTSDLYAAMATILPGAHGDDNGPIVSGKLIETAKNGANATSPISVDSAAILANSGNSRLGDNLGMTAIGTLVAEAE